MIDILKLPDTMATALVERDTGTHGPLDERTQLVSDFIGENRANGLGTGWAGKESGAPGYEVIAENLIVEKLRQIIEQCGEN